MKRINWNIPGALAAALLGVACGGTSVSQIPVGDARCPNGGADVKNGSKDQVICSAGPGQLTKVSPLASGDAHCSAGGEQIDTGADNGANGGTAGNGVLEGGEINSTQYVCTTASVVSRELALADGDAHCPTSGTELDIGLDDGKGGGVAGDGILEQGEIRTSQFICNSDGIRVGSFAPPAGSPGAWAINASGGNGSNGAGGNSSSQAFHANFDQGTLGGHLKVFTTGAADAGFAAPAPAAATLGSVPVTVASDTEVVSNAPYADAGIPVVNAGVLYTVDANSGVLFLSNGDGGAVVTDLAVSAGAKLTLDASATNPVTVNLSLPGELRNAGVITTSVIPGNVLSRANLNLSLTNFVGLAGSSLITRGLDAPAAGTNGGNGGNIFINGSSYAFSTQEGSVYNAGAMDSSGGSGDSGGAAGAIQLSGEYGVTNLGSLTSKGGNATLATGVAGQGRDINLHPRYGYARNAGALDASGGSGGAQGGNGARISLYPNSAGITLNSGALVTNGGDASATCTANCSGGNAGNTDLEGIGGDLISSGAISARGGSGAAGRGGQGSQAYFGSSSGSAWYGNATTAGNVVISGSLDMRGGDGAVGGAGGGVFAEMNPSGSVSGAEIQFLGYGGGVKLNGGNGSTSGGSGGTFYARNSYSSPGNSNNGCGPFCLKVASKGDSRNLGFIPSPTNTYATGGSVLTNVTVSLTGGNGTTGNGGYGGSVDLETQSRYFFPQAVEKVIATGSFDTSGGSGNSGGGAGNVNLYGRSGVMSSSVITANAGSSSGASTPGVSNGNYLVGLFADSGLILNSGAITTHAGNATGVTSNGGNAPSVAIEIVGPAVQNSGALSCVGGNGTAGAGNGGSIHLTSTSGVTANTAALVTSAGGGATPGTKGSVFVDGQLVPN